MSSGLFDLTGRVALVTGASRGIGQALALGLAEAGADVALAARTREDLERVAEQVRALGRRAVALPTDVRQVAEVRAMVAATIQQLGGLDVLVNNAGLNVRKPATELSEAEWDFVTDIDLKAVFFATQAAGQHWLSLGREGRGKAKVINIASLSSAIGLPNVVAYAASKSGVLGITRTLALEWATRDVCVNAIAPGYIETPLTRPLFDDPQRNAWIHGRIPMGVRGYPADLVGTAVYLAAPASDYVSGQTIFVDGGWTAA